jgi:Family of unknown function (DUF6788)
MPTSPDPDLRLRGRLLRSLGRLREMLPGSFVERKRACGRANCRCADGRNLHTNTRFRSGRWPAQNLNIPAALVQRVRDNIELRRRFEAAAATICNINLRRCLNQKRKPNLAPTPVRDLPRYGARGPDAPMFF